MVCIITRSINGPFTSLVKAVDSAISENQKLKSFVVYINEDEKAGSKALRDLAKSIGVKNVPLTLFQDPQGPDGYDIDRKADVTIMLWSGSKVKINHAYRAGDFTEDEAAKVAEEARKLS